MSEQITDFRQLNPNQYITTISLKYGSVGYKKVLKVGRKWVQYQAVFYDNEDKEFKETWENRFDPTEHKIFDGLRPDLFKALMQYEKTLREWKTRQEKADWDRKYKYRTLEYAESTQWYKDNPKPLNPLISDKEND